MSALQLLAQSYDPNSDLSGGSDAVEETKHDSLDAAVSRDLHVKIGEEGKCSEVLQPVN
jgi:hypothetical protein